MAGFVGGVLRILRDQGGRGDHGRNLDKDPIAEWKGEVAGFTVSVLHQGSWTLDPICYLEDLFVAPKARGHGIGRALIADLLARAKEHGWSRLYWHTRQGNAPARRLYDKFAVADDFVRYRLTLT